MKKQKRIIINIVVILIIVIAFDIGLVFIQKQKNKEPNSLENSSKQIYIDYDCHTKEKTYEMTNGKSYKFIEYYKFLALNDELNFGEYTDTLQFENLEDYQYFYNQYIDKNNDYFTMEYDENHYKIIYKKNMILKKEENQSTKLSDGYLDYLEEQGFICEQK